MGRDRLAKVTGNPYSEVCIHHWFQRAGLYALPVKKSFDLYTEMLFYTRHSTISSNSAREINEKNSALFVA
jgi:hypothetical protein